MKASSIGPERPCFLTRPPSGKALTKVQRPLLWVSVAFHERSDAGRGPSMSCPSIWMTTFSRTSNGAWPEAMSSVRAATLFVFTVTADSLLETSAITRAASHWVSMRSTCTQCMRW